MRTLIRKYPEVQLATLVDAPPEGPGWLNEVKVDGYRLLGFLSGGTVVLRTRSGKDWTAKFPSIKLAIERLKARDAVLDMEAVILDSAGKSNFQALQGALGKGGNPNEIVAIVFDLLYLDGNDLSKLALAERKERLKLLLKRSRNSTSLSNSDHVSGQGPEIFAQACKRVLRESSLSSRMLLTPQAGRIAG